MRTFTVDKELGVITFDGEVLPIKWTTSMMNSPLDIDSFAELAQLVLNLLECYDLTDEEASNILDCLEDNF